MAEILYKANFSIQVDESTIYNEAVLLVYVRFIHEDDIKEYMLIIKSFPETTCGEDIFNELMQYFNGKNIPLTNLIHIASDGVAAMTGKVQGFVSRMESVAAIHTINFVKTNSVNDRLFEQLC